MKLTILARFINTLYFSISGVISLIIVLSLEYKKFKERHKKSLVIEPPKEGGGGLS